MMGIGPAAKGACGTTKSSASTSKNSMFGQALEAVKTQSVAILFRDRDNESYIRQKVPEAIKLHRNMARWYDDPRVFFGTYYSAKGLEFDTVILPFSSDQDLPLPEEVENSGPQQAMSNDAKLLYVAITRARVNLILLATGNPTAILPDDTSMIATRIWK